MTTVHIFAIILPNDCEVYNMKSNIAYKFRLYPTNKQKEILSKTFGCCRFIYNKMLEDKIKYYEEFGRKLKNTPAMYKNEHSFLKEVDSQD